MPDGLVGYRHDLRTESALKRLPHLLGSVCLILIVASVALFSLKLAAWGAATFAVFLGTLITWAIIWKRERTVVCAGCGKAMEVADFAFPSKTLGGMDRKWLDRPLFEGDGRSLFESADGCIYEVDSCHRGGLYWKISRYNLRFYVCHACKTYCRYGNVITLHENMKTTDEIEALKSELQQEGANTA